MTYIEDLYQRRKVLSDFLINKEYEGYRELLEDLYPDNAHFIFELLQNAEDTGATKAYFNLKKEKLVFEHNGSSFTETDLEAITNIGQKTKKGLVNKIGRFGIGFRSVFEYTQTPHIWSPSYSFKIVDYALPVLLDTKEELAEKTRFEIPFNNPLKDVQNAFTEISIGLQELSDISLLFLNFLASISWKIDNGSSGELRRITHDNHLIEIQKTSSNNELNSSFFLCFSKSLDDEGEQNNNVSIAYDLEFVLQSKSEKKDFKSKNTFKIVSAHPGKVAIFFPAKKEVSGLRFHVHGPFVPDPSRASIKENKVNQPVFENIAKLASESLSNIRDMGLLTSDFLGVLPNPQDELPENFSCIREAIINEMRNHSLTPTFSNTFAPAAKLYQAKASFKNLISNEDLRFFLGIADPLIDWSINATQKNSDIDRFLEGLQIPQWDLNNFIQLIKKKTFYYDSWIENKFIPWLSKKTSEWHQKLYALLYTEAISTNTNKSYDISGLRSIKLIRLQNGEYCSGKDCFFPSDGFEDDKVLPRVSRNVYLSGKKKIEQANAKEFLKQVGVREVGVKEEIERILKLRYSDENFDPNINDISRFLDFFDNFPEKIDVFSDYYIFKLQDNKWGKPKIVYLDKPFLETGLSTYYSSFQNKDNLPTPISHEYLRLKIDHHKFVDFLKKLEVIYKLRIINVSCSSNPDWGMLSSSPGNLGYGIDNDYSIENLEEILEKPSSELSLLIWRTMNSLDSKYLTAIYQKRKKSDPKEAKSQLIHILKQAKWIPQINGAMVKPCDAERVKLPKEFTFIEECEWREKVEFGLTARLEILDAKSRDTYAQKIGFSSFNEALKWKKISEEVERLGKTPEEIFSTFFPSQNKKPNFPHGTITNPERHEQHLLEALERAPEKEYHQIETSKRVTDRYIDAQTWLRNYYTNSDSEMVCQICREEMPFKKLNGEYYFEAVEAFNRDYFGSEYEAQYLALCPLCAAKYKVLIKTDKANLRLVYERIIKSSGHEVKIKLGEEFATIGFVQSHLDAIQKILGRNAQLLD